MVVRAAFALAPGGRPRPCMVRARDRPAKEVTQLHVVGDAGGLPATLDARRAARLEGGTGFAEIWQAIEGVADTGRLAEADVGAGPPRPPLAEPVAATGLTAGEDAPLADADADATASEGIGLSVAATQPPADVAPGALMARLPSEGDLPDKSSAIPSGTAEDDAGEAAEEVVPSGDGDRPVAVAAWLTAPGQPVSTPAQPRTGAIAGVAASDERSKVGGLPSADRLPIPAEPAFESAAEPSRVADATAFRPVGPPDWGHGKGRSEALPALTGDGALLEGPDAQAFDAEAIAGAGRLPATKGMTLPAVAPSPVAKAGFPEFEPMLSGLVEPGMTLPPGLRIAPGQGGAAPMAGEPASAEGGGPFGLAVAGQVLESTANPGQSDGANPLGGSQLGGEIASIWRPDTAGFAANPPTGGVPGAQPSPAATAVAVAIAHQLESGVRQFTVRLDPPDLGAVEVRLRFGRDGSLRARITSHRGDTLALLSRDPGSLQQALEAAGIPGAEIDFGRGQADGSPFGGNQPAWGEGQRDRMPASSPQFRGADQAEVADGTVVRRFVVTDRLDITV